MSINSLANLSMINQCMFCKILNKYAIMSVMVINTTLVFKETRL